VRITGWQWRSTFRQRNSSTWHHFLWLRMCGSQLRWWSLPISDGSPPPQLIILHQQLANNINTKKQIILSIISRGVTEGADGGLSRAVKLFSLPFPALSVLEITISKEWERSKVSRKLAKTQHSTQWTTGHRTRNIRTGIQDPHGATEE
jgi:hypothetical protein